MFGFPDREARVHVAARSGGWRAGHALLWLGLCWALVPIVVFIPPHVPWAAGAFLTGIYMAHRKATEAYTLLDLHGECPKCGAPQVIESAVKLKRPHPLTCERCHQDLLLRTDPDPASEAERSAA